MQTFTLTVYGAQVRDVQRLLTEAGLTGLSFDVAWAHSEPDDDVAAGAPTTTDSQVDPALGRIISDVVKAKQRHPSGGGS
jgi:hypothetical protein